MQKVLIITYYWPPAGGPGVQRWLKFVKYLPEFNVQPIVFIPKNPHYPLQDATLENEVPEGIEIIKEPIIEPYGLAALFSSKKTKRISAGIIQDFKKQSPLERLFLWIRGNLFIPDARKFWVKPAVKSLKKVIKDQGVETIITTGPPHSVHLIGMKLKEQLAVRWLADFRDPWTSIGYHKKLKLTKASQKNHQLLEGQVLNTADTIIVTSNSTGQELQKLTEKPIQTITNGYDGDFVNADLDASFTISHIGSLLTNRNPENLWQAISELVAENKGFKNQLKVRLVGVVSDEVIDSIKACGIDTYVEIVGYVPHQEVAKWQSSSQLLLLLEIDSPETRGIIPGKIFEYFKAKRPILAIGPKEWEAGQMVEDHEAGNYVLHKDMAKMKQLLLKRFERFQKAELQTNCIGIEQYHRRELTKKLAKLL